MRSWITNILNYRALTLSLLSAAWSLKVICQSIKTSIINEPIYAHLEGHCWYDDCDGNDDDDDDDDVDNDDEELSTVHFPLPYHHFFQMAKSKAFFIKLIYYFQHQTIGT